MDHHIAADIDAAMGHTVRVRRVIGIAEEYQIAGSGVGRGNRGAEIAKPLRTSPPHVPAAVIDDPGHEAGTVKGGGGTAAAPNIGFRMVFIIRLEENTAKWPWSAFNGAGNSILPPTSKRAYGPPTAPQRHFWTARTNTGGGKPSERGADMEQDKKREYMGRLTLELLAYDSEAVGEAIKCRLSGADPDKLTAAALEAYNAVLELETLKTDF